MFGGLILLPAAVINERIAKRIIYCINSVFDKKRQKNKIYLVFWHLHTCDIADGRYETTYETIVLKLSTWSTYKSWYVFN